MQNMTITFDGADYEFVPPKLGDLVAFERHFGLKASVLEPKETGAYDDNGEAVVAADIALEWIAFLLWRSLRRQEVIGKDVEFGEDFLDLVEGVEMKGGEVEIVDEDPTAPVRLRG